MKTFVPTWKLLMSAMRFFPEDVFSREKKETVDYLYQDMFIKRSVHTIISQDCASEIVLAAQALLRWQEDNNIIILDHKKAKEKVLEVIAQNHLPETVEISVVRSLWSAWGLIAELDCIPGRPLKDIVAMFRQDYPGTPEHLLPTVACRAYEPLPLASSAFDIRDWCRAHPRPENDDLLWTFRFGVESDRICQKYNLPEYLE